MSLTNQQVAERIQQRFGDKVLSVGEPYDFLTIEVDPAIIADLVKFLKEDSELSFNFLTDLCGIHYPERKGSEIGIVYHLHSFVNNFRLRLKCFIPEQEPVVASLTGIFPGANWMERETYDFFGVKFSGHPDLRRILNVEEMNYSPMLKQYPLEDATREDKQDEYFGR